MKPPLLRGNMGTIVTGWANPQQSFHDQIFTALAQYFTSCYTPNHGGAQFRVVLVRNAERVKKNYEAMEL